MEPAGRTLVVGLGNPVVTDDGVGWRVAERLRARLAARADVTVGFCCRGGLALMERLVGYPRAIVVDAILTGAPPGTVHTLSPAGFPTRNSASTHDMGLPTALALGRAAGARLPAEGQIVFVAVEAGDVTTFGERCTPAVEAAVEEAAARVEELLAAPPDGA